MSWIEEVLADAPGAVWDHDTLADASGNGNTLTDHGTTLAASIIPTVQSRSRSHSGGGNRFLDAVDAASIDVADKFTISGWLNLAAIPSAGSFGTLFTKGVTTGIGAAAGIYLDNQKLSFGADNAGPWLQSASAIALGTVWFAIQKDGTTVQRLYIGRVGVDDDIVDDTGAITPAYGPFIASDQPFTIGYFPRVSGFPFDGRTQGFAVWKDVIVDPARLSTHYRAGLANRITAIPDFVRGAFPFVPVPDQFRIGRGRPGRLGSLGLMRGTGPHPAGGFERFIVPRLHPDVPAAAAPIDVNLGELAEVDALLSPAATKSLTLAELAEADALLAIAATKARTLAELTETDSILPAAPTKSSTLAELAELDAPLTPASTKSALLAELAELDALLAIAATKAAALAELAELDALLPIGGGVAGPINVNLAELAETDSILPAAATKSSTLAELAELDALPAIAASKAAALAELAELDALLPIGGGVAGPINVNLAELAETDSILPAAATKSSTLAELAELDALLSPAPAKSVTLAELAGVSSLLAIAASKARILGELAELDALLPATVAQAKSVTLGQLAELDALLPVTVAQAKSITVGLLAELDLLLTVATTSRLYHPRAGKVSVSGSSTSGATTSRGRSSAAVGLGATEADVTPTGTAASVSDAVTSAEVS